MQRMFNWPGLIQECQPFLNKFHIQKVCQYSPYQWKRLVKTNILKLNKILIIERAEKQKYKKVNLDRLKEDDFDRKLYLSSMNVHDARMRFKLASKMFPTVQMNFQSDRKFMAELWSCAGCTAPGDADGFRDSQEHLLICESYKIYREGKDLDTDEGLVSYFKEVLNSRLNLC